MSTIIDVAKVNGFDIVRERRGAAVVWHAEKVDEAGYEVAAFRDLPTRKAAEAAARKVPTT